MNDISSRLANRLRDEGKKTVDFFKGLSPEQWEQTIYTDGSCWNTWQIMAHFVASEKGFTRLLENILEGGSGSPEDFDIDGYNERKLVNFQGVPSQDLINQFNHLREQTITLVEHMEIEDFSKIGRHPFLGVASIESIVKLIYLHNQIHIREMRKILF